MRSIDVAVIRDTVAELVQSTNYTLERDLVWAIEQAKEREASPLGADILANIEKNIRIAKDECIPLCQDTGMACVFLEIGQEVAFTGGYLYDAIHEGVRRGYKEGYLRGSIVKDPLRRVNSGDNTPAHIHVDLVPGDLIRITVAPKGFGSENMSRIKMLPPSAGEQGVKDFVLETVHLAGGNPCPPMVLGVGIGGSFDSVALLAKKALLLPLEEENADPYYQAMEQELLREINKMGIGPQGFGGSTTALGVHILTAPTHIAGLPVAVNVNCHVSRHETRIL